MSLDQRADQLGAHFSPPGALSHRESAFVCLARDGMALGQAKHGSVDRSRFLIGAEDLALRYGSFAPGTPTSVSTHQPPCSARSL